MTAIDPSEWKKRVRIHPFLVRPGEGSDGNTREPRGRVKTKRTRRDFSVEIRMQKEKGGIIRLLDERELR